MLIFVNTSKTEPTIKKIKSAWIITAHYSVSHNEQAINKEWVGIFTIFLQV